MLFRVTIPFMRNGSRQHHSHILFSAHSFQLTVVGANDFETSEFQPTVKSVLLCLHSSILFVLCVTKNALDLLLHCFLLVVLTYCRYMTIIFSFTFIWYVARYRLADFQKTWSWCLLGTFSPVLRNSGVHRRTEYGNLIFLYILYTPLYKISLHLLICAVCWPCYWKAGYQALH